MVQILRDSKTYHILIHSAKHTWARSLRCTRNWNTTKILKWLGVGMGDAHAKKLYRDTQGYVCGAQDGLWLFFSWKLQTGYFKGTGSCKTNSIALLYRLQHLIVFNEACSCSVLDSWHNLLQQFLRPLTTQLSGNQKYQFQVVICFPGEQWKLKLAHCRRMYPITICDTWLCFKSGLHCLWYLFLI